MKWKKPFSVMTTTVLMASMFAGSAWANESSSSLTSVVSSSSKLQRELVQKKLEKQLKKKTSTKSRVERNRQRTCCR
ncbi:hypothetical protein [Anoxybacillus sp. KU2-6(11)]|uniref:hypothetical protein n=1 Tax=Anoxybacillus sp. KU2-6(11) TaxID=1535751 RepID=UPI0005000504|nr:hypothetical protein [Anoxybacillus sp. KU2-6(11)]KFZ41615.1 hypothetical protein JS80_16440 [Anoxybacillus sp. KU2-6(11)]